MKITDVRWGSLVDINNRLEELESARSDPLQLTSLFENVLQNRALLEDASTNETVRFIKCLYKSQEGPVNKICLKILGIAIERISFDLEAIRKLKEIDYELYQRILGDYISGDDHYVNDLMVTKEEILEAAPYISKFYIDCEAENSPDGDEFFTTLFERMGNGITELVIDNSSFSGNAFKSLNRENLISLGISGCLNFNSNFHNFPKLEILILEVLEELDFNVQNMPKLKVLKLHCIYSTISVKQFSNLEKLTICGCSGFNEPIQGFQLLKKLTVDRCRWFNSKISDLPMLRSLSLKSCKVFNSDIENIPNLERFIVKSQFAEGEYSLADIEDDEHADVLSRLDFKIFERSMDTLLLVAYANIRYVYKMIQKMSEPGKLSALQKCIGLLENISPDTMPIHKVPDFMRIIARLGSPNVLMIPLDFRGLYQILKFELYVELNLSPEPDFYSLNDPIRQEIFLHMVYLSPIVVAYLLENTPREFWELFKTCSISFFELSNAVQDVLLPYVTPEMIREIFSKLSEVQKQQLLEFQLGFNGYFDSMDPVLRAVKQSNIDTISEESRRINGIAIEDFLSQIPLMNLACYAERHPEVLSAFCYAMTLKQLTAVIPLLDTSVFINMIKKMPFATHKAYLALAAADQRVEYVARDLLVTFSIKDTITRGNVLRDRYRESPSEKTRQGLEQYITCTLFALKTSLQQDGIILKSMKPIFTADKLEGPIEAKEQELLAMQNDLETYHKELLNEYSRADHEIPEKFYDPITGQMMIDPLTDGIYTMDKSTWKKCNGIHPYTRSPFELENLKESDLKNELAEFKTACLKGKKETN